MHACRPLYTEHVPSMQVFTEAEIASVRKAGKILRDCLEYAATLAKPGVTTREIDLKAEQFILERGGKPGFKGYHNYPSSLCISVNEECVHGLPGDRVLKDGDLVSLDGGVMVDGLHTDACLTVIVGTASPDAERLLRVTTEALQAGINTVHAGSHVGDISEAVQKVVEGAGCTILKPLTGHGLGYTLHQFPDIPNYGKRGTGARLVAGTIIAIEPITCLGSGGIRELDDGWTIVTADGSLSAHMEHTILVTENGCEIIA